EGYLRDGTYEALLPPLQALVHIMIDGKYEGKDRQHPDIRKLFTREAALESDWYKERLVVKQQREVDLWTKHVAYLENFLGIKNFKDASRRLRVEEKLQSAKERLEAVKSLQYLKELQGTIGADPLK